MRHLPVSILLLLTACPKDPSGNASGDHTLPRAALTQLAVSGSPTRFEATGGPEGGLEGFTLTGDPSGFFHELGLRTGEVWVRANGRPLDSSTALQSAKRELFSAGEFSVTTRVDGEERTTQLLLSGPPQPVPPSVKFSVELPGSPLELGILQRTEDGFVVERSQLAWLQHQPISFLQFRLQSDGQFVTDHDVLAPLLGLQAGDLIQEFDGQQMKYPLGLSDIRHALLTADEVTFSVKREGASLSYTLHIDGAPIPFADSGDSDRSAADRPGGWREVGLSQDEGVVQVPRGALVHHCASMATARPYRSVDGALLGYTTHSGLLKLLGLNTILTHIDGVPLTQDEQVETLSSHLATVSQTTFTHIRNGQAHDTTLIWHGPPVTLPDDCTLRLLLSLDEKQLRAGVEIHDHVRKVNRSALSELAELAELDKPSPTSVRQGRPASTLDLFPYDLWRLLQLPKGELASVQGQPIHSVEGWTKARRALLEADRVVLTFADTEVEPLTLEIQGPAVVLPAEWPGKQRRTRSSSVTPTATWVDGIATVDRQEVLRLFQQPLDLHPYRGEDGEWNGYKIGHRDLQKIFGLRSLRPTALDGKEPTTDDDVKNWLRGFYVADSVSFTFTEQGQPQTLTLKLEGAPVKPPSPLPLSVKPNASEAAHRMGVRWEDGVRVVPRSLLVPLLDNSKIDGFSVGEGTVTLLQGRQELTLLGLSRHSRLDRLPDDPDGLLTVQALYDTICSDRTTMPGQGDQSAMGAVQLQGAALSCPDGWTRAQAHIHTQGSRTERGYRLSADEMAMLKNPSELAASLRCTPWKNAEGAVAGYRMLALRRDSLWSSMGFLNGDVVTTVSGTSLTSMSQVMHLYESIEGMSTVEVELRRRNKTMVLVFEIP